MTAIAEWTVAILILLGTFLSVVSAFGVWRLPDVYTRNHAASKSTTMGVMVTLLGALLYFYAADNEINSRLLVGIVFIFVTAPVAGHLISRAAYHTGVKLSAYTVNDDLAGKKEGSQADCDTPK
ncbi:MAG TPA: monovalent cation/H(+) antiporter subunit G [Bacillaceae bacterium]